MFWDNWFSGKSRKISITVLQPRDKRAFDVPIIDETDTSLICKTQGKKERRYYKSGPGWSYKNGLTKFFGIEGSAYTMIVKDDSEVKVSLSTALRDLWGQETYDKMPKDLRDQVENHVFGVTITPEEIPKEDKTRSVSAENADKENIKTSMEYLGHEMDKKRKTEWIPIIMGVGVGAFAVLLAVVLKWIKV